MLCDVAWMRFLKLQNLLITQTLAVLRKQSDDQVKLERFPLLTGALRSTNVRHSSSLLGFVRLALLLVFLFVFLR